MTVDSSGSVEADSGDGSDSGSDNPDAVTLAPPTPPTSVQRESPFTASPVTASPINAVAEPRLPGVVAPPPDYSEGGVPSLDFVRDKIEGRYALSLGSTELAQETPEARSFEEQAAKREDAAKEKLEAIRRSLRGESSS